MNWYETVSEEHKPLLFATMRQIQEQIDRWEEKAKSLQPSNGQIGIGCAWFDELLKADAVREFMLQVRHGKTPQEAEKIAKTYSQETIVQHNEKRKDINWKRWQESGFVYIEKAMQKILASVAF